MFGDFSRDSFDPSKHYTRVLMQQGRPLTDADWNEQVSSLIESQRQLARAVIGWHGSSDDGFTIIKDNETYKLKPGTYFVDGLRCDVNQIVKDRKLQLMSLDKLDTSKSDSLIYLDVWEQPYCAAQDPSILEPAMRNIDSSCRSRVLWAVRQTDATDVPDAPYQAFVDKITNRTTEHRCKLKAERLSTGPNTPSGACEMPLGLQKSLPDRLYRVEIHRSGPGAKVDATGAMTSKDVATFKWSRTNGSTVASLQSDPLPSGKRLTIDRTRFVSTTPLQRDSWCELLDAEGRSVNDGRRLTAISQINGSQIDMKSDISVKYDHLKPLAASFDIEKSSAYFLRQWDHSGAELEAGKTVDSRILAGATPKVVKKAILAADGCLAVIANSNQQTSDPVWIELEDGLAVQFLEANFVAGDHWLIRTYSNGTVSVLPGPHPERPRSARTSHHYAPIGKISGGNATSEGVRKQFKPLGKPYRNAADPPNTGLPLPAQVAVNTEPTPFVAAKKINIDSTTATPVSLLSSEGAKALKGYFASPQDLTRRVFARHLNQRSELQSERYKKYRSALLLSEILETSFERYFAKVDRCLALDYAERPLVEADARADYELAMEFERTLMADDRSKSQLA